MASYQRSRGGHKEYQKRSATKRNLTFLISEAQRNLTFLILKRSATSATNFLIRLKRNAIAELHFCNKLKRNLTFAIRISHLNANTDFYGFKTERE